MAEEDFLSNQDAKTSDTFEKFLNRVQTKTKEQVENFSDPLIVTAENGRDSQNKLAKQLEDALAQSDVVEVWKLIAKNETGSNKTLKEIYEACTTSRTTIAEGDNNKENACHFQCSWNCKNIYQTVQKFICNCFPCNVDGCEETPTEMRNEEERRWIEILSNPLYVCLEWLWRNNPPGQYKDEKRCKESKFADIIEAALDDSYLLEKIASYEHYYSRDEYKHRAEKYETFAADIVEQADTSPGHYQKWIYGDVMRNGNMAAKARHTIQSPFQALFGA